MEIQTESYIVLGDLPNEERYHCLICGCTPDRVMVDLFVPEPKDIPASVPLPNSKTLVMPYRLCPRCAKAKSAPWRIRLLILERLNVIGGGSVK
jgi:hypothetical protein